MKLEINLFLIPGGYFRRPQDVRVLKNSILEWCAQVRLFVGVCQSYRIRA